MSDWSNPGYIILEGEDEAALKARFVELSARYPHFHPSEIGQTVFGGLRDGMSRGSQAGYVWSRDLEVLEAVRQWTLTAGSQATSIPTKETVVAELHAISQSVAVEAKDRIAALKTIAEIGGYITKQVQADIKTPKYPAIIFKKYEK